MNFKCYYFYFSSLPVDVQLFVTADDKSQHGWNHWIWESKPRRQNSKDSQIGSLKSVSSSMSWEIGRIPMRNKRSFKPKVVRISFFRREFNPLKNLACVPYTRKPSNALRKSWFKFLIDLNVHKVHVHVFFEIFFCKIKFSFLSWRNAILVK